MINTECLFRYQEPVSPHLAAKLASESSGTQVRHTSPLICIDSMQELQNDIPSDTTFVNTIASYIRRCASASSQAAHMYVETAGGES